MSGDLKSEFVSLCEEYGRGTVAGEWATAKENRILERCTVVFEKMIEGSVDVQDLFVHSSEFVRYLAGVNALYFNVYVEPAKEAIFSVRDGFKGGYMQAMAQLIVFHFKLDEPEP